MANHAPALGTMVYSVEGGRTLTFPGDVNTRTSSKQIPTADGRSIKCVEHTLTVDGWLFSSDLATASGTVDGAFDAAKEILSQAGGILTIVGKGFGDISVNGNISINRDLSFGPFPKVIDWQPFGNITCKFKWEVSFTLPWKKNIYTIPGVLDYWWTTSYKYDSSGFCDRVISGELEMAGTRVQQSTIVDRSSNIENYYKGIISVDCPLGFHRTGHDLATNAAKTKIVFSFSDEQDRGLTYPPGICDMDVTHEMSASADKMTISKWIWAFSATATPEAKFATSYGYRACLAAFESRFQYMIARAISTKTGNIIPFPVSIKVSENVKTRKSTLSTAWIVMAASGKNGSFMPEDILARSGLWQPFEWTGEQHKAVADAPLGPNRTGGFTQMTTDMRQNIILDISSVSPYVPDPGLATGNRKVQKPPAEGELVIQPFGAYLEFKAWVSVKTHGDRWVNYAVTPDLNDPRLNKENVQEITNMYNEYMLRGYILRCGIPAAGVPEMKKIAGVDVEIPAGKSKFVNTYPVLNALGMVIWRTDFIIPYVPVKKEASNPVKAVDNIVDQRPANALKTKADAIGFFAGGAVGDALTLVDGK